MSHQLIQGVPWSSPMKLTGFGPSNPHGKKRKKTEQIIMNEVKAVFITSDMSLVRKSLVLQLHRESSKPVWSFKAA